jgi:patatin-like phospholipase/acyl hydrolase
MPLSLRGGGAGLHPAYLSSPGPSRESRLANSDSNFGRSAGRLRFMPGTFIENPKKKRILALDGGGVRGIFTIEILARMEALLRERLKKPHLVLADHFQFMAGTSTGAIIATLLAWGHPVEKVRTLYRERCHEIFPPVAPWRIWKAGRLLRRFGRAFYGDEPLSEFLQEHFFDDTTTETAKLGSSKLRTQLLLCMRNSTTGSAWAITNNPRALYNQRHRKNCNLDIPIWKLVRASTAAPLYFLPELIDVGETNFAFVDGGVSPYNNPALIAVLSATQPCYQMEWPTGTENLHVVSIGTGRMRSVLKDISLWNLNLFRNLMGVPSSLMDSISLQQDFLCRVMGACLFGHAIDREVGDLITDPTKLPGSSRQFTYVRYDHEFPTKELVDAVKKHGEMRLDNVRTMPFLASLGEDYAKANVQVEHLL